MTWCGISEKSADFSDIEWLRIYNAALKRAGLTTRHFYFLPASVMMMAMVGRNRDEDATAADFPMLKRKIRPGLGGDIVERPTRPRQQDELAGKFRDGKTFILTDLRYRFTSQNRRGSATNIQGGLEDLGYEIGRMRKKEGKKKEPKAERGNRNKSKSSPALGDSTCPRRIIECTTEAVNVDAVDGTAPVIDVVIITHLKARCKSFYPFMINMYATEYKERVVNQGTIPEFDRYYPYLGADKNGELKPPTEGDMKALFAKKKPKEGEIGGRDEGSLSSRNNWHANLVQTDEAPGQDGHETNELQLNVCRRP